MKKTVTIILMMLAATMVGAQDLAQQQTMAFVFVLGMMLLTVGFTGCRYFKPVDGPGMERDSADIAAMDSMAMKAKEDIAGLIKELYAAG